MPSAESFSFRRATTRDAGRLADLHTTVAEDLTNAHGSGPWSGKTTERGVLFAMRTSDVYVARLGTEIVGSLRLTTKKPWAIDASCYTDCVRPLYLVAMAVAPHKQGQGIGRRCLEEAKLVAAKWPADAVRLDAYDARAGAGQFYVRCGWSEVGRGAYRDVALIYYEWMVK